MVRLTALSVAGLVVLATVIGYAGLRYYEGRIARVHLTAPAGAKRNGAEDFLLVGSDTRVGVGGGFGNAGVIAGQRSDTVILAHLPAGSAKPTLVSFPRDSYVLVPAYTDPSGHRHPAHMDKLNAAYALGGPQLLVNTIHILTGLRIDHYVEVNFAGFKNMVNALGGITLCARTSRHDPANGPNGGSNDFMTAGIHPNVNGAVALAFVRDRHSFADQDISRIHDQQYFLAQMMKKVLSAGTLTNPFKLTSFLSAATKSLRVDSGLSLSGLRSLAERLRHADPAHVTFVTIPFTSSSATAPIDGVYASVVRLDPSADQRLFTQLNDARPAAPVRPAAATDVRLTVENGTQIAGFAHRTAVRLRERGFTITRIGTTTVAATQTIVRYPPAQAAAAAAVADALAAPPHLVADPAATGVTLTLGSDYRGVRASSPASATATHTPTPSIRTTHTFGQSASNLSCGA